MMKINYKVSMRILVIVILIALIYNFFSPNGIKLIREETTIQIIPDSLLITSENNNDQNRVINGISLKHTYNLFINKSATFIDARDQWDFNDGHIAGAINIPEFSFDATGPKVTSLNRDALYVIYCEGDDCDVSKRLAVQLIKLNFKSIYVFLGGWAEWINARYPIVKGEESK